MNKETNYWKTAEQMNGRLAMMGFFAAVINYGITGWIKKNDPILSVEAKASRMDRISSLEDIDQLKTIN